MNEPTTCIHPDCKEEAIHYEHPLCISHAWAVIAAIAEAKTQPDKIE